MLRPSVIFNKVRLFHKGNKLFYIGKGKRQEPKKVDKVLISKYAIIDALKTLIQLHSLYEILSIGMIPKQLNHFADFYLFLTIRV